MYIVIVAAFGMSQLASLWMPSLTAPYTSDAWFPRLDLDTEEVLVSDEAEMTKVMDAIRNKSAPIPIGQNIHGKAMEEEEFDTTATHQGLGGNDDDADDMDDETASLQSHSESGSSMDDDSM